MKIDQISDGFRFKMSEAGVEDAASERILTQNTPKDIDCRRVLIQNSRPLLGLPGEGGRRLVFCDACFEEVFLFAEVNCLAHPGERVFRAIESF